MGMMPADRSERWDRIFRRYAIPGTTSQKAEVEPALDTPQQERRKRVLRTILPEPAEDRRRSTA
ncbi:MAG: hypothetical protein RMJ43_15245 [Chloroherpetonaceae bacterium]|nr:hypothetical protein [Chthonomonadaceae bacterium]MDW8209189.1 hypothetical protein [Chloroherpetonaceae bacterium]